MDARTCSPPSYRLWLLLKLTALLSLTLSNTIGKLVNASSLPSVDYSRSNNIFFVNIEMSTY